MRHRKWGENILREMWECLKNMSDKLKAANKRRKISSRGKLTKNPGQSYFLIGNENKEYTENVDEEK